MTCPHPSPTTWLPTSQVRLGGGGGGGAIEGVAVVLVVVVVVFAVELA